MKKVIFTVLAICIAHLSFSQTVSITVDASAGKTRISPSIFGMNNSGAENLSSADWQRYRDAGLKMFRENGGNNATKYNWRRQISSHPDWYNNVYGGGGGWDTKAKKIRDNMPDAYTMWAFQLIGKAASNTNNNFNDWTFNQSQWWSGVCQNLAGGGTPNTSGGCQASVEGDINKYLMDWPADSTIGILDYWFGNGGLGINKETAKYWSMDNEANVWDGTHNDVIKTLPSAENFMQSYFAVAKKARAKFPDIKLAGPVPANEWQWYAWGPGTVNYNGTNYCWMEYFIRRIADEQAATGIRLLDVVDIHYYPGASTSQDILQLHRTFFDKNFVSLDANGVKLVNGGWDNSINKEYIFARINEWLTKYMGANHGVTLGLTEICIGSNDPNVTALWYASMLGTFADNGVELFTPWCWNTGMLETLHLFSRYGKEFRVQSISSQEDIVSAYSSVNANADSMTIVLVNRSTSSQQNVSVQVNNFPISGTYNTLALYNLPNSETFVSHTNNALKASTVTFSNSTFTATLPPLSITAVTLAKNGQSGGGSGTILREYWNNISGTTISSLTSNANYPDSPTGSEQLTSLEGSTNVADNYGDRIRGYVFPPVSGAYTFWVAGDDNTDLYLSTDDNLANATRIAYVAGWTNSQEWTKYTSQKSASINLTAGQKYYIEVLHKEGSGGDNEAVSWQGPGISQAIIAGSYLSPFVPGPAQYTLSTSTTGTGSISLNPMGGTYSSGTVVTVTATAGSGYQFSGWSGDLTGTTNPATITMNANKSVTATFQAISGTCANPVAITVPFSKDGAGSFCWVTSSSMSYINSWNLTSLKINGVDYTNKWSNNMPAAQNGQWYIEYSSSVSWGHFEASAATKSAPHTESARQVDLRVYPNPFTVAVNLEVNDPELVDCIVVLDQLGRQVEIIDHAAVKHVQTIGTSLKAGMYMIQVRNSDSTKTIKIFKK